MFSNRVSVVALVLLDATRVAYGAPVNETTGKLRLFQSGNNSEGDVSLCE
jgi:hypothetical protein